MILPLGSIMEWERDGVIVLPSEHARTELSVDTDRIVKSDRMQNARLRQYFQADKRTWSCGWVKLPSIDTGTVDGKAGGASIEEFYRNTPGEFTLRVKHKDTGLDIETAVVFSSFDKTHVWRGVHDFWDISISLEEV